MWFVYRYLYNNWIELNGTSVCSNSSLHLVHITSRAFGKTRSESDCVRMSRAEQAHPPTLPYRRAPHRTTTHLPVVHREYAKGTHNSTYPSINPTHVSKKWLANRYDRLRECRCCSGLLMKDISSIMCFLVIPYHASFYNLSANCVCSFSR